MKNVPVGATWEGKGEDGRIYQIWLERQENGLSVWRWVRTYSDGSRGPWDSDWGPSYESCRKQMYLGGSGIKMKRVK